MANVSYLDPDSGRIVLGKQLQRQVDDGAISMEAAQQLAYNQLSELDKQKYNEASTMINPVESLLGLFGGRNEEQPSIVDMLQASGMNVADYLKTQSLQDSLINEMYPMAGESLTPPIQQQEGTAHDAMDSAIVNEQMDSFVKTLTGEGVGGISGVSLGRAADVVPYIPPMHIPQGDVTPLQKKGPGKFDDFGAVLNQILPQIPSNQANIASYRELDQSDLSPEEKFNLILQASRI
jgi:hypothetical protein